jgi:trans-aconitate methyltransferase
MVFLNPRPQRDVNDSGYDPRHGEAALLPRLVERGLLNADHSPNAERLVQRYEKLIELTRALEPNQPVVDIGCGIGTSTMALQAAGISAVGFEVDPDFVAIAQRTFGLDVREADIAVPFAERHPVATLNSVLEHIDDPTAFLRNIRANVLTQAGALVVTVPNLASTEFVHRGTEWPIISQQHVLYFTERTLAQTAVRAGFEVEDVWAPPVSLRPTDHVDLWTRAGLGHTGNVSGGIGMTLRATPS